MRTTISKESVVEEVVSLTCDICKKTYDFSDDEWLEAQEFTHISFTGGYGSVFGDGAVCELDICQHCLKDRLGKFIRHINSE